MLVEDQLDFFADKMNLLTSDNKYYMNSLQMSDSELESHKKFLKITRYHSVGLLIYTICTVCIFMELVILLIVHRAKGGVHRREDFLYK